jgi:NodT family efflux transporter outer membrane factor (OMF) lipoprotein
MKEDRMRPPSRVRLAVLAACFALLQGCATVGPDFKAPPTAAPATWGDWHGGDAALAADAASAASLASWDGVLDAPLRELLARARINNADVRTAALHFAEARTQRTITQAQLGPQVNATASATRQRLSETGAGTRMVDAIGGPNQQALRDFLSSPYTVYDAAFDASWELDLWGQVRRSIEAADAAAQQSNALLDAARLEVQAEVARTYFELRGVQAQLRLARADVDTAREAAAIVAGRARGGVVADLDAIQQRTLQAQVAARVPLLQRQESALLDQLTLLVGEPPGSWNALLRDGAPRWPAAADLALGIPSELAARRPDVQAALARLHAATAQIGVAVGDLYPRITLTGDSGFESLEPGQLATWGARQWRIGPSLTLPIFDRGRLRRVVELRELQQQEAAIAFQQVVLKAWHEVDTAVADYQSERRRAADLGLQVRSAQDSLALASARYRGGLTNFMPVLDAQRTLTQAQGSFAEHQTRLATAWVALLKALAVPAPQQPPSS